MPKLLEGTVARIQVPDGARDVLVFDDALPGFGIRKFASGRASFFVKYSLPGGQQRKITLGAVIPGVTAEMRKKASDVLAKARLGQDVAGERKVAREKKIASVGELIGKYLAAREGEVRPVYHVEKTRYLSRYFSPLHSSAIEQVTRRDVVTQIDRIADEHGKVAADRARAALSSFFAWAIDKSYIDANPIHHIRKRATNGSRTRVLSEKELIEIWNACRDDDYGRIIRLLILTGQRKAEIGDLSWAEIDTGRNQIDLPAMRTKNKLPHIVPLSDPSLAIIDGIERRLNRDFLFGEGGRGFQGWSRAKKAFDARLNKARAEDEKKSLPAWTIHDIRRSMNTHLNENGIAQPHIVEAVLNHASGHKGGVAGVYNKAQYLPEKRAALEAWGKHVVKLVSGSER